MPSVSGARDWSTIDSLSFANVGSAPACGRDVPTPGEQAVGQIESSDTQERESRPSLREWVLAAAVLVLPLLVLQLANPIPRVDGDAVEYLSLLHTLGHDHDLHLDNEFAHYGILGRWDKRAPTSTGYMRTIYAVGPAVLWLPFYVPVDALTPSGANVPGGFTPLQLRAVMLGSLFYAAAGLLLVFGVLRRLFDGATSLLAVALLAYATFLAWYVVYDPFVSHAGSFGLTAGAFALWWHGRVELSPRRAALLGLALGLAFCVRPQNGLWLLLPGLTILAHLRRSPRAGLVRGSILAGAFSLGALPQLLTWKTLFGSLVLSAPPQGADYIRLGFPHVLASLFSSRHGLLFWTPILWAGFVGFVPLVRRRPRVAAQLGILLLALCYVNVCVGEWWAGGSFSNRRFDSTLPLLALGLAASITEVRELVRRRPMLPLLAAGVLFILWNALLMEQYRRAWVPKDGTVAFERIAEGSASILREGPGTPLAWPANWVFAWRHDVPPGQWDELVGQYLFFRQNNLEGRMEIGLDHGVVDHPWLAEGWTPRTPCEGASCRAILGHARLLVPLDLPEALEVTVRAAGQGELTLGVNGRPLAAWPLSRHLAAHTCAAPEVVWHRDINDLTLEVSEGGTAVVDWVHFRQRAGQTEQRQGGR
jgi:hypothetical protein